MPAPAVYPLMPRAVSSTALSLGRAFAPRVLALYVALYVAPFPLDLIPGLDGVVSAVYGGLWDVVVPWVGQHLLAIDAPIVRRYSGSGDTLFHYVSLFAYALFATLGAIAWTLVARRRGAEGLGVTALWLRIVTRYYLASTMLSYGFVKLFKLQFPAPSLERLITPYGESSPMGLAWTFMGYSTSYTVFSGALEVVAGLLLLSRRLTLLGSLVAAGVMTNVVMLNFSYDIAVKQYSLHLLGFALLLMARDRARLYALFASGRPAPARVVESPWRGERARRRWRIVCVALSLYLVTVHCVLNLMWIPRLGDGQPAPPLYGLYEVERFELDGRELPPLLTADERWRWVIFDRRGRLSTLAMDGAKQVYSAAVDEDAGTLTLTPMPRWYGELERPDEQEPPPRVTHVLTFTRGPDDSLALAGELDARAHEVTLQPVPRERFRLLTRGFRWVQEYPYNR